MGQSLSLLPREGSLAVDRTGRCQTDEIITGNETINEIEVLQGKVLQ